MILSYINIPKVQWEVLKTENLRFSTLPSGPWPLANVNEWKIMFDPSIVLVFVSFFVFTRKIHWRLRGTCAIVY